MSHGMNHPIAHGTAETMVDTTAHSPSPFPLPPVGHPCLSSHWCRDNRPLMDEKHFGGEQ